MTGKKFILFSCGVFLGFSLLATPSVFGQPDSNGGIIDRAEEFVKKEIKRGERDLRNLDRRDYEDRNFKGEHRRGMRDKMDGRRDDFRRDHRNPQDMNHREPGHNRDFNRNRPEEHRPDMRGDHKGRPEDFRQDHKGPDMRNRPHGPEGNREFNRSPHNPDRGERRFGGPGDFNRNGRN